MNPVFDLARFSSELAATLRGGQSPLSCVHELSRQTERLAILRRACEWVEELGEVNPRICDQPLMGHNLAVLTGESLRPPNIAAAQPRGDRRQFNASESASQRNSQNATTRAARSSLPERVNPPVRPFPPRIANMRRSAEVCQPVYQPEVVYQLQTQADGSLLRRAARWPDVASVDVGTSSESNPIPPRSQHKPGAPLLNERMKRRDWRDRLAQRAAASLLRNLTGATQGTFSNEQEPARSRSLTEQEIKQFVSLSLMEQWVMPLGGEQAPANALTQLANPAQLNDAGDLRETKRTRNQSQINKQSTSHLPEFPNQLDTGVRRDSDFAGPFNPNSAPRHLETALLPERPARFAPEDDLQHPVAREQAAGTPSFPANNSWQTVPRRDDDWLSPADISPLTPSPTLPPLHTPRTAGAIASPVVAAQAHHQATRQEEIITQERDLSLLAAQLKQVLDEEARRHGIDV